MKEKMALNLIQKAKEKLQSYPWIGAMIVVLLLSSNGTGVVTTEEFELVWDYETDFPVGGVSVSSDRNYIAAGTEGNSVYFFDEQGKLLWNYKTGGKVYAVSVSGDGNYVGVGSYDNNVYFFDREGRLLWSYETGGDVIHGVSVSRDGNYVGVGSYDNNVYFFDREGRLLWSYHPCGLLYDVSVSPDGSYIAASSWGSNWGWEAWSSNSVYFFNKEGELLWSYEVGTTGLSVSVSEDGNYVAVGSYRPDYKLYLFDRDGKLLWNYSIGADIYKVSISSDGNYIAAISNKAYLFNKEGKLVWSYEVGGSGISISSDGSYISIGGGDLVYFFVKTKIIATNAINEAKSTILSIRSKGFAITDAESLLLQAENAFNSGEYKEAKSFSESAETKALEIDEVASGASSSIYKTKSVISQEKSKGFNVSKAESLISHAESAFKFGDYKRARELADKSYSFSADIDQDGIINEKDFAPYINNYYIYAGVAAALFIMAILTKVSLNVRRRNLEYERKIEEYRAKVEQWKSEGYKVDELEDILK